MMITWNITFSAVGVETDIDLTKGFNNTMSDFTKLQNIAGLPSFSIHAGTGTTLTHWCNAQSIHFIAPLAWLYTFFISAHAIMHIRIGYRHKSHTVHAPYIPL